MNSTMPEQTARKSIPYMGYIDGLRFIIAFFVVFGHIQAQRIDRFGEISINEWSNLLYVDSMLRFAVPCFLMITGVLILGRPPKTSYLTDTLKRYSRILPPMIFWCAFQIWWEYYYYSDTITVSYVLDSLYSAMGHTQYYYLFVVCGLYLITPFLNWLLLNHQKFYYLLLATLVAMNTSDFTYSFLTLNAFTYFIPFTMYYMMGPVVNNIQVNKPIFIIGLLVYILCTAWIYMGSYHLYHTLPANHYNLTFYVDPVHLPIFLQSIGFFLFMKEVLKRIWPHSSKLAKTIASMAFGVYLAHSPLIDVVRTQLDSGELVTVFQDVIIETAIVFPLVLLLVYTLLRIPIVRRIVS